MKAGMTKVTVMYPNSEGATFDFDYYTSKHFDLVGESLGDALKSAYAEKGVGSAMPGSKAPYIACGVMFFDSVEAFGMAFGPHAQKIMGDIRNFTNVQPQVQISEVL